jgi:hypothetical protein
MLIPNFFIVYALMGTVQAAINDFYPIFLNEERCSGKQSWTMWFNVGKPESETSGDIERKNIILRQNPTTMWRVLFGIHAQSFNYRTGNWSTG